MDKNSNSKFQFRLPNDLIKRFKLTCQKLGVKPSEKLRSLMVTFLKDGENEKINKKKYVFPEIAKDISQEKLTIGEMYCGPGGIALAAKKSKLVTKNKKYSFEHVWATDNHQDTCMTFQKNIPNKKEKNFKVICEDISENLVEILPYVDGFLYGFPCNDFSNVGETKGLDGEYGPLYSYGIKYINKNNPKFIFAENVSGISNANSGNAFTKILQELRDAGEYGYELSTHLYKFEEYGVPQTRHRFIIVGIRKDLKLKFQIPKPPILNRFKTCKDAITDPPIKENCPNHDFTNQSNTVKERLKFIKPGENAWTANLPDKLKLNVKGAKLSMIYKRLDPVKPAYTITGSGGGGTHMYHWSENRALTNRERARLQTFPDNFIFHGSKESVRRQIGMAVPVDGVKIILLSILKTFAGIKYETIDANHQSDQETLSLFNYSNN